MTLLPFLLYALALLGVVRVVVTVIHAGADLARQREAQVWLDRKADADRRHAKDIASMYLTSLLMADDDLSHEPDLVDFFEVLETGATD